jgi:hypothetical protein
MIIIQKKDLTVKEKLEVIIITMYIFHEKLNKVNEAITCDILRLSMFMYKDLNFKKEKKCKQVN